MTKKLNPNEAPPGYVAVASSLMCKGCAFDALASCYAERAGHECTKRNRKDGHSVIFIKRPAGPQKLAALDSRYSQRMPAATKAKAQRIGGAAVIAAIEAAIEAVPGMKPLTTSQAMLLALLRKAGRATTAQLGAATERADRDVLVSLHRLQDHGLIRREPAGQVSRYWEAVP